MARYFLSTSFSVPMMPKSSAMYLPKFGPSMATRMLPGCMSAWKKPSRNTWVKKISTPARASFLRSTPLARRRSICADRRCRACAPSPSPTDVHQSQYTSGTSSSGESAKLRRNCEQLAASRIRSSSSCRCLANSATTSRGFRRLPSAHRRSSSPARASSRAMSWSMTGAMPGRRIFTATSRPPVAAGWRNAPAPPRPRPPGRASNVSNTCVTGLP